MLYYITHKSQMQTNYNCTHKKEARDCFECNFFLATARIERRKLKKALRTKKIAQSKTYNKYLGCTYGEYYDRLSEEERNIIDYGHLDHIKPITKFDFDDISQLYDCCNWRNIRIICKDENISKRNTINQDLLELLELPIFF